MSDWARGPYDVIYARGRSRHSMQPPPPPRPPNRYINSRNIPICKAYFPNSSVVTLDTGHWVQAEKPNEFVLEIEKFLKS